MDEFRQVAVNQLIDSPLNPRTHFDTQKILELADSMLALGIIEPLVVRPGKARKFEIVAGSRRFRAAEVAAIGEVPCVVRELTDEQALEIMVVENSQREDVNPLEEAEGFRRLLAFMSTEMLAAKIGHPVKYVYDRLKFLQLTDEVKNLLLGGKITAGHAILLARLDAADQKRAIDVKGADAYTGAGLFQPEHGLFDEDARAKENGGPLAKYVGFKARSVRELESWIDRHVRFDRQAPIDPMLFPETAETLTKAAEEKEKVVQITHNLQTPDDAKAGLTERIYHASSWKRVDEKPCERAVTGVVVIGAERGKAFKVCLSSTDCAVHWAKEKRQRARARERGTAATVASSAATEKLKRLAAAEEQHRQNFKRARPAIIAACMEKIKSAKFAPLAELILSDEWNYKEARKLMGKMSTIEDLARMVALDLLMQECSEYNLPHFTKVAALIGVDIAKLVPEPAVGPAPGTGRKAKGK